MKSILSWKEETTKGTSIITAANTVTSYFGKYNETVNQKCKPPTRKNVIDQYHNYSSRKPNLVFGTHKIPNINVNFHQCAPIGYYHFLGKATTGAPATIETEETADKPSITIHHQEPTVIDHVRQLVGSQAVAIGGNIEMNMDEELEVIYAGMKIIDEGVAPVLTTVPTHPEAVDKVYHGKPKVTYDVGGADTAFNEVYKVIYSQSQNISINHSGSEKDINLHQFEPVDLRMTAICETDDQWDDLVDEVVRDITVRSYKSNTSNYKDMLFNNAVIEDIQREGLLFNDRYIAVILCKAEYFELEFINEYGANFSDWFG